MKKLKEKFLSIIGRGVNFFKPNPIFFKILFSYKRIIKNYYSELFLNFKLLILNKNYWFGLIYNKNISIFKNIILFLLFAPIFRFVFSLFKGVLAIIYSFYYIFINIVFDLIIAYVDIYARKLKVFYESSLIKDINVLRKVILLTDFKQNFFDNFRKKKDINIDGFIYREEFHHKFFRISINLFLFFIWWMPLFLSFFSYIVRVIMVLIWGIIVIIFFFFAKGFMLVIDYITVFFLRLRIKIFIFRYRRLLRKTYNRLLKKKRRHWIKFGKVYIILRRLLTDVFNINKVILNLKWNSKKIFINNYIYYYHLVEKPYSIEQDKLNINFFKVIFERFDDKIINRLNFFNNISDQITLYEFSFFSRLKMYIMYILNLYSFDGIMHFFLGYHAENYISKKYVYKYKYKIKIRYLRMLRKLLLFYWDYLFLIIIIIMEFLSIIIWLLCLIFVSINYFLEVILLFIRTIFYIIIGVFIIFFFGKEK